VEVNVVSDLNTKIAALEADAAFARKATRAAIARAEKAEAENVKLKEALRPFARFGEILGPPSEEGFDILIYDPAGHPDRKIVGDDCRRARAALAECTETGHDA
jgi:hypothetical protein